MPDELRFVIDRARRLSLPAPSSKHGSRRKPVSLAQWRPNEANAILYSREDGHILGAHCDHRALSGAILATLSLAGDCTMTYTKAQQLPAERYRVQLPRRSIQIQTGTVRYDYMHGIRNQDLPPPPSRRVSITFRMNAAGFGYYDDPPAFD